MRTSHIVTSAIGGLLFTLVACSQPTAGAIVGSGGDPVADAGGTGPGDGPGGGSSGGSSGSSGGGTDGGSDMDGSSTPDAPVFAGGSDHCADATQIPLSAATPRLDLLTSTVGATHDIDVPCSSGDSPDVFYKFAFTKRVFVYADTFGAGWNTSLFLLDDSCNPITTSTTPGDAVCNEGACGTQQARIVAVLEAGNYRLGLSGRGGASGAATIHFEWTIAGSGSVAALPPGNSVQTGETYGGGGNIDGLDSKCIAAGGEDSYWWARCPSDPGGPILASTCGGATWETVVDVQIPGGKAYTCGLDTCGLQTQLPQMTAVPAGAGLGVLSIDGQSGSSFGPYSMTVTRP